MKPRKSPFAGFALTLLILMTAQCFTTLLPTSAGPQKKSVRKNVLFIVGDDHGLELGCYGNPVIKTPNLDGLAAEGVRFDFAFCTTPSCSPSRSVILSGLQNHTNGQYGLQHATHKQSAQAWVQGLPNLLRKAGYNTASLGKVHVAPEESFHFDAYPNEGQLGGRSTVRIAENAENWIRQNGETPFFVYVGFTDPHRAAKGFANERAYPGVQEVRYDPKQIPVPHFLPDQPEVRQELAGYYQAISRLDQGVGRLVEALKKTGHYDDTLIVYTSDNGMPFPGAKTSMYDAGTHLPLIVRSPEAKRRGAVSHAMVSWVDFVPTVLQWTGARGPDYALHGRSFLPALDTPEVSGWDEVYGSHQFHEITMYYPVRSLRTRRYKYLLNLAHPLPFPFASDLYGSDTWQGALRRKDRMYGSRSMQALLHRPKHELYDLEQDPKEVKNLAEDPTHASVLAEMQRKVRAWQEDTRDPWLVKYEHE